MSAAGPPEAALPLLVAEAERWQYDLTSVRIGELVLEAAQEIPMPTMDEVALELPADLLHRELRILDMVSRGRTIVSAALNLRISERTAYLALAGARKKIGARTDMHAARCYTDLGELTPLRRRHSGSPRLSTSEFVVASLGSRGWTNNEIRDRFGGARSTINTQWQLIRAKLDGAQSSEEAIRRALSYGGLAFDRILVS